MALASQERTKSRKGREAAKVRLAELADAASIAHLLGETRSDQATLEEVIGGLEQGGALLLEGNAGELLCAARWSEAPHGWTLQEPTVLKRYQHQELDRWVLTKLEALAIQRNIPTLKMRLDDETRLPYYQRMGYGLEASEPGVVLSKRVGGTWQTQGV